METTQPGSELPDERTSLPVLSARHVSKTFQGAPALVGLSLDVHVGEIHALLGENGSGKSTFVKILSGFHRPDDGGEVLIDGEPLTWATPAASYALGCRFVHQDLGLVGASTVLDNLNFISGFPTRLGSIRTRAARREALEVLARVGLDLDPNTPVADLTPAVQTGVAIARALRADAKAQPRLLVLDEPTATLPDNEVSRLAAIVRHVAAEGLGVIYVTHRINEVFALAHRLTVLRDGRRVTTRPVEGLNHDSLVELLVESEFVNAAREAAVLTAAATEPVLSVRSLNSGPLRDVDLDVEPGVITGIAGITGSGRETILASIFGGVCPESGQIQLAGQPVPLGRPDRAKTLGLAYLPPDRKAGGGFMALTAEENVVLADVGSVSKHGRVVGSSVREQARQWMKTLRVSPSGAQRQDLRMFSGGNQQKILFAKWLRCSPKVFLLDEPTQGVDIGSKALLHHELVTAAQAGTAVVVASSDVEELAALCGRVVILRAGRIAAELVGGEISQAAISRAALGAASSDIGR